MPRVKRGTTHTAKRKKLLDKAKGYKWGRKSNIKVAKTAVVKAGAHALRDRRRKKRVNRSLWLIKINAACRANDLSYSKFIKLLKDMKVEVDRKILAELASKHPKAFSAVVEKVKK